MAKKFELPLRARLFILAVVGAGGLCVVLRIPAATRWTGSDLLAWGGLVVAIAIIDQFPIALRHGTETQNWLLTDSLWAAALLLVHPSVLTLAVAGGVLVGEAMRRWTAYKIAFNIGQFLLGVTVAELIYREIHPPAFPHPLALVAAGVAMLGYFLVNTGAVALVIAIVEGKSFRSILGRPFALSVLQWAGNTAVGILGALVWTDSRIGLPLLIVPLAVCYLAYQGRLRGMRERDRMRHLYETSQLLLGPLDEAEDFRPLLGRVEQMLEAPAAELVIIENGVVTIHDSTGTTSFKPSVTGQAGAGQAEAYVRVRPGLSPNVALIGEPDQVHGVLAVYREQTLSGPERSLLDALASQVSVRLQNARLYFQTVEQRTQLEDIIGHSSDGIFLVSPGGRIMSWNAAMERITGFVTQEALGRTWDAILGTSWADVERVGGRPSRTPGDPRELHIVRKDRVPRWIRYTRNSILDRDGKPRANVVVARDVTAELEAEQLKSDFVATISHELRTPLTPLKGFLAALLHGTVEDTPETRGEYYRIMLNQANRLERLITDLLEVSQIESDKPLVEGHAVELTAAAGEQVQEFSQHDRNRSIELRAPGDPIVVHADPVRLGQVMGNLISNAIKYSPAGTPVEVRVARQGDQAHVSVRDEGEGIPESDQERVFGRFQRLDNSLTRQTGGTGLGLYIAKRLVEAMGGRIWVDSTPGVGSSFTFSLPLAGPIQGNGRDRAGMLAGQA